MDDRRNLCPLPRTARTPHRADSQASCLIEHDLAMVLTQRELRATYRLGRSLRAVEDRIRAEERLTLQVSCQRCIAEFDGSNHLLIGPSGDRHKQLGAGADASCGRRQEASSSVQALGLVKRAVRYSEFELVQPLYRRGPQRRRVSKRTAEMVNRPGFCVRSRLILGGSRDACA